MQGHLFKITNIDLNKELKKMKETPTLIKSVKAYPVDYDSLIIIVTYKHKPKEILFFKSISYGLKKYSEIKKIIRLGHINQSMLKITLDKMSLLKKKQYNNNKKKYNIV